jgi:hypothetical protein
VVVFDDPVDAEEKKQADGDEPSCGRLKALLYATTIGTKSRHGGVVDYILKMLMGQEEGGGFQNAKKLATRQTDPCKRVQYRS